MNTTNKTDKNSLIKMTGIQKKFNGITVLDNVDLTINRGEVVAIIGPSGSGKSTLLRSLVKLEDIDQGEIYVNGDCFVKNTSEGVEYAPKDIMNGIRMKFGMVFQDFPLFPHMTVLENISLALIKVLKLEKEKAFYEAREILKKVELDKKYNSYSCELSGGQKQRAAIARALALDPEIILFDEPTSALDPELAEGVLKIIKRLVLEKKKTIIVVTHNMKFAKDIADRVVFMEEGKVVEEGVPEEIFSASLDSRICRFLS